MVPSNIIGFQTDLLGRKIVLKQALLFQSGAGSNDIKGVLHILKMQLSYISRTRSLDESLSPLLGI